jgi:hypothetical protein
MTVRNKIYTIIFFTIVNSGCKTENHIDRYNVSLDSLKTLPDAFYAYRHGRVYIEDLNLERYRIWFNLDVLGNVESIFKIEDFKNSSADKTTTIKNYNIDTLENLKIIQRFINLSKQFKFGHISIDRANKISFSYKDGLPEQYVRTFNDSMRYVYANKKNFKSLQNGWFRNVEQ